MPSHLWNRLRELKLTLIWPRREEFVKVRKRFKSAGVVSIYKRGSESATAHLTHYKTTPRRFIFCILHQVNLIPVYIKETLCSPKGIECYKNIDQTNENCLLPCNGMYLDVTKTPYAPDNEEDSSDVRTLMAQYESYKRWFEEDITYDQIIQSINCNMYSP